MTEALFSAIRLVLAAALMALPGIFALSAVYPDKPLRWRWITGSTMGLAAAVCISFFASYLHIAAFIWLWLALTLATLIWWRGGRAKTPLFARPSTGGWLLIAALSLTALLRVGTIAGREVPRGWDSAFHCIFVEKILLTGQIITDWQPFENITLNYPLGSHTLMAGASLLTGDPPHVVFNILIALLGVPIAAEVYALAAGATLRRSVGILAAILYGLLAVTGSIDYPRWGGLPNALGMLFVVAFMRLLIEAPFTGQRWIMAFLVAAIILAHHHVMLTACVLMAAMLIFALVTRRRHMALTVLLSGIAGSILASAHILSYLRKAGQLGAHRHPQLRGAALPVGLVAGHGLGLPAAHAGRHRVVDCSAIATAPPFDADAPGGDAQRPGAAGSIYRHRRHIPGHPGLSGPAPAWRIHALALPHRPGAALGDLRRLRRVCHRPRLQDPPSARGHRHHAADAHDHTSLDRSARTGLPARSGGCVHLDSSQRAYPDGRGHRRCLGPLLHLAQDTRYTRPDLRTATYRDDAQLLLAYVRDVLQGRIPPQSANLTIIGIFAPSEPLPAKHVLYRNDAG